MTLISVVVISSVTPNATSVFVILDVLCNFGVLDRDGNFRATHKLLNSEKHF